MTKQFGFLLFSRIGAAALQATAFIILSRVVSVKEFGWVGITVSLGAFVMLVTDFGITGVLSRARAREDTALVAGCIRTNDIVSGLVAILTVIGTVVVAPGKVLLVPLMISIILERNAETQLSLFYADGDRVVPLVSILGRRLIGVALFGGLVAGGLDAMWAFGVGLTTGAGFSVGYQKIVLMRSRASRPPYGIIDPIEVIRGSVSFWISSVLNQIRVLDTTIVAATSTALSAGLYSAAQKLTNPLLLIPVSLAQILLPYAARPGANVSKASIRVTQLFLATYILIIPGCFFDEHALGLFFGTSYRSGGAILTWMMLGLPVLALSGPLAAILQGCGGERFVAVNGALFAVLALVAMAGGGAIFGAVGVAAGLAIASGLRVPVLLAGISRYAAKVAATASGDSRKLISPHKDMI